MSVTVSRSVQRIKLERWSTTDILNIETKASSLVAVSLNVIAIACGHETYNKQ